MANRVALAEIAEMPRHDGPWSLPKGWSWEPLGKLGTWMGGGTPSKANAAFWINGSIPWVSPKDMKVEIIGETEDKVTIEAIEGSSAKYVPERSVLMVMRSGILRHSFPVAVTDRIVTLNQDLRALTPHKGISPNYVARYLALAAKRVLEDCSKDGTTVNSIEVLALERLPVPLAPPAEQRRIVARVSALFADISEGEAALAAARKGLDTFRRALLKAAVTGELTKNWRQENPVTETGHDLIGRIIKKRASKDIPAARARRAADARLLDTSMLPNLPEGWAWATIRELADVIGGLTKNPDREKMLVRMPYLRVANVRTGGLNLSEMKEIGVTDEDRQRASLKTGDLLIVEGNGSIDQIGRCALWSGEIAECVHQNHIIKARFSDSRLPQWCLTWLLSPYGRTEIEQVAASTSGLHTLSISKIEALPIPIPPPAEGNEILRRISEAFTASADTLAVLDAEASDAARLKQSVLKAAFEGRLARQDPNEQPVSALLARLEADSMTTHAKRARKKKDS
jgi:type I restriction enzyme S subunit